MKTKILSLFTFTFLLLFACQVDDTEMLETENNTILEKSNDKTEMVSVPFKSNFSVWDRSDYSDTTCGEYPIFTLTMEGTGNIAHMGTITTVFTFCVDTSTGAYWGTEATFVAANGDKLYAIIPTGQIVPNEELNATYYQTKFNDEMTFIGGTGRFEGAEGTAWTHAYVHDPSSLEDEWRTDFFSSGTLKLKKGNK